ncbi:unnamed protein product [Alternaria alternata]
MHSWDDAKETLEDLWLEKKWKLDDIVKELSTKHHFYKVESQYKAQFKKWGWSKNFRKSKITTVAKHYKSRAAVGKPFTRVFIDGKQVEGHKVRRVMKDQIREATRLISLNRNLITNVDGRVLPFGDSLTLSDWLYQYWFFCFKTAKHWGKGPRIWTAELLNFDQYLSAARPSLPGTPQDMIHPSASYNNDEPMLPSDLCRWYIHVRQATYEEIPEEVYEPPAFAQPNSSDERTWTSWSPNEQPASLQAHLRDALEHNDFSPTPATDLPVAIPQIAKAADEERSSELLVEALGFSIMSRNVDQMLQISRQLRRKGIDPVSLHPIHLATSFLDGSKTCCDAIFMLTAMYTGAKVHAMYLNEHGHTILDNLMIAIIKSHTSARPVDLDDNLRDVERFAGEEVDICGRWDADSPCADVSVAALLSIDSFVECDHVELTAAELAEEIMALPAFGIWNTKIKTGWAVLTGILRRCEAAHVAWARKENLNPESHDCIAKPHGENEFMGPTEHGEDDFMGSTEPHDMLQEMHFEDLHSTCFTGEKNIGTLWSSVQAEFLSYRRLNDGLGWMSQYFSMESLREKLEKGEHLVVGYTEHNLLKAHCACHSFGCYPLALLSDAIDPNLANLDVWERATYGILLEE